MRAAMSRNPRQVMFKITIILFFLSLFCLLKSMKNLLLVDDDPMCLSLLSLFFCKEGYNCMCASCCSTALASMSGGYQGIVISDVKMPVHDGRHLLKKAKQEHRASKFIMMSSDKFDPLEFYLLGALDFYWKMEPKEQLIGMVESAGKDKRTVKRLGLGLPVLVDGIPGLSLNLSGDGILFKGKSGFKLGSCVEFKARGLQGVSARVVRSVSAGHHYHTALYFDRNIGKELAESIKIP